MTTSSEQAVYLVESARDDPRSEGFALVDSDEPSLLGSRGWPNDDRIRDFYPSLPIQAQWTPPHVSGVWRPLRVTGRVRAWNDFPTVAMTVPAVSQRAVDALRDILDRNGELLPLEYDHGRWFAYNCWTVVDIVDHASSAISFDRGVRKEFDHYAIFADRLASLTLFRMRENVSPSLYATQPFVDRVRQAGLRNFVFEKIWPWPKGTIWVHENKKLRAQRKLKEGPANLGRHSVVIRLMLAEVNRKPNKQEREHVELIMDTLDALLADPHATYDAPVFGNLEGDEPVNGEHRLFLCCPDADRLVERLRLWLHHLDWPGPVVVVKRYGDMHDEDAPEKALEGPW